MATIQQVIQKDARIRPAENGLILSYTEYMISHNCYDGLQYIGEKSEVFTMSDEDAVKCINKLISIYKQENVATVAAAMFKSINSKNDNDGDE